MHNSFLPTLFPATQLYGWIEPRIILVPANICQLMGFSVSHEGLPYKRALEGHDVGKYASKLKPNKLLVDKRTTRSSLLVDPSRSSTHGYYARTGGLLRACASMEKNAALQSTIRPQPRDPSSYVAPAYRDFHPGERTIARPRSLAKLIVQRSQLAHGHRWILNYPSPFDLRATVLACKMATIAQGRNTSR